MTVTTHEPDPDDAAAELDAARAGQSTTAEEAMDAVTDEDGFAGESAYTPSTVDQQDVPGSDARLLLA
jgi:hypothetical protein